MSSFSRSTQLVQGFLTAFDEMRQRGQLLETENSRLRDALRQTEGGSKLLDDLEQDEVVLPKQKVPAVDAELEAELARFANLHLAANALHSTLDPAGVARRLKEILEQLVGIDAYALVLAAPRPSVLLTEGLGPNESPAELPLLQCEEVATSGASRIADAVPPNLCTVSEPLALLPLQFDSRVVGILVLIRSLPHKTTLDPADFELFELLGLHAAVALMAAGLFAQAQQRLPDASAFASLKH